jgi:hypothetical protein
MLVAVAALALGAYALPGHAATLTAPNPAIGIGHGMTQAACVWRHRRVHIHRHVRPDGRVVPGHWVRQRVKVCR